MNIDHIQMKKINGDTEEEQMLEFEKTFMKDKKIDGYPSLFLVKDERVLTPEKDCGILSGITREKIIQLAHENGIVLVEGKWPGEELFKADEIFLSGTVKKIMPVSVLDNHPVGSGKPGPLTQKIMRLYLSLLKKL